MLNLRNMMKVQSQKSIYDDVNCLHIICYVIGSEHTQVNQQVTEVISHVLSKMTWPQTPITWRLCLLSSNNIKVKTVAAFHGSWLLRK